MDPKLGSERSFGFVFAGFFFILGAASAVSGTGRTGLWLGACFIFAFLGTFFPKVLKPLNLIWFRFGLLLHSIVSPLIMVAMFFLVITPIAISMRLLGKRPFQLTFLFLGCSIEYWLWWINASLTQAVGGRIWAIHIWSYTRQRCVHEHYVRFKALHIGKSGLLHVYAYIHQMSFY